MKMKNIKYLFLSFVAAASISCNKFLDIDPSNTYSESITFSNMENLDLYVKGFYGLFYSVAQNNVDPELMTDGVSDLIKYSGYSTAAGSVNRFLYGAMPMTPDNNFRSIWHSMYDKIRRCNEYFCDVAEYGNKLDADLLKIRTAEVRFIRAYAYYRLVTLYGGVILRVDEKKVDGPKESDKARSSEDECWTFILNEFKKAAEDLPEKWNGAETGRLTKGAAFGMMARVSLYAKRWKDAIEACNKVLEMGYSLMPGKTSEEYMRIFTKVNNSELIMASYFQQGIGMKQNNFNLWYCPSYDYKAAGVTAYAIGGLATPSDEYASSFDIKVNGKYVPFDWKNLASYKNKPFDDREPRFYASILYNDAVWKGRKLQIYKGGTDGYDDYALGSSLNRTTTGYFFRKFLDDSPKINYTNIQSASFWTEMRLPEIYFIRSEAKARLNDFKGAYSDLNMVHTRVGLPTLPTKNVWEVYLNDLAKERICELGLEGHRYFDLVRWGLAVKVLNHSRLHAIRITPKGNGFSYERVECDKQDRLFPQNYTQFPIPQSEIRDNEMCKQNPNW